MTEYKKVTDFFKNATMNLLKSSEGVKSFGGIITSLLKPRALDLKQKEMIAISLAIASRCDACIGHHVAHGIKAGITREEMLDIIDVCVLMGGGPSMMFGASALSAYDELLPEIKSKEG